MKINIKSDAHCNGIDVHPGEFLVALHPESREIYLTGAGTTYKLKATKRKATQKVKRETINFMSGGGKLWSLIVTTPKQGEWVSFIEYY